MARHQPADRLGPYRAKRDPARTPEPAGTPGPAAAGDGGPRYVIQKHDARRLHYDLRLEADGVLVSWAVPKGPSLDPATKRLAVHVEDHPLDYRRFEGVIPGAQYGSGTVLVWDQGIYRNLTEREGREVPVGEAVEAGHLSVWLEGSKLQGGWSLTRTGGTQWLLVKRSDELADPGTDITVSAPDSVVTGRSLEQVKAAEAEAGGAVDARAGETGTARAAAGGAAAADGGATQDATAADRDPVAAVPAAWVEPMLATTSGPDDPALRATGTPWRFERKLDGLRCIAVRHGSDVQLWSRNHLSFNRRFPGLVAAVGALPVDDVVIDGEIVAYDGNRTSFGLLQQGGGDQAVLCAFDLPHLLGRDTTVLALGDRVALLAQTLAGAPPGLVLVEELEGGPEELMDRACAEGWEGIVAKRLDQPYRPGRASGWRKLKCSASQELVVGGWTEPGGGRTGFGALLVGYYDDGGGLRYAGRVGTGFTEATLRTLAGTLGALARRSSPYAEPVRLKGAHWVEPELVAEIAFTEWTADGRLRHPSFKGLRPDKAATDVRRETR